MNRSMTWRVMAVVAAIAGCALPACESGDAADNAGATGSGGAADASTGDDWNNGGVDSGGTVGGGGFSGAADTAGGAGSWDGGSPGGWSSADASTGAPSTGPGDQGPNGECAASCTGRQCGPDGCGGTCGWCGGNDSCQQGVCVAVAGCVPACAGAMIGADDSCGGVCSGNGFGIGLAPGGAQDASYFRQQVLAGEVPSPDVLPIEGWLTEHGTSLPPPLTDRFVTLHGFAGLFYDPAQGEPTVALQLGMNSGVPPEVIESNHFNLCVVVDRSGSMEEANKITYVREGLLKMLDSLDADDTLSIVLYSTEAEVALKPTKLTDKEQARSIIKGLTAGGSTNLASGLKLGYEQVLKNIADKSSIPRVILLSDGIPTAGVQDTPSILAMSGSYTDLGVGITTIGVGTDFNFALMHGLAAQGLGNFYFLDTAEKLVQVFEEEIKYLLTPVADNLKIWFTLPEAFGVDAIYGFEFKEQDGEIHMLGPSPQYEIDDGTVVTEPPAGGGEEPDVAVSTLFASKKNGLLMVKLNSPKANLLKDMENAALTTVYYEYQLVEEQVTEYFTTTIELGSLDYDTEGGFQYFSGAIMQRNFCILRAGLAMKEACTLFNGDPVGARDEAIQQLVFARTFCTGINVQLKDPKIDEDIALIEALMENVCAECVDPASQP